MSSLSAKYPSAIFDMLDPIADRLAEISKKKGVNWRLSIKVSLVDPVLIEAFIYTDRSPSFPIFHEKGETAEMATQNVAFACKTWLDANYPKEASNA